MIEKYIEKYFVQKGIPTEYQSAFLELLTEVTADEKLLSELQNPPSSPESPPEKNDTFIFDLQVPDQLDLPPPPADSLDDYTIDLTLDESWDSLGEESLSDTFDLHLPEDLEEASEDDSDRIGRYLNLGILGRGGMGEVRKVRDQVLKRDLAMKIIHPRILKNPASLTRFVEEAQIGAQLQHPNIVPVHELGTLPDGRYYFTMKEVKGTEFSKYIKAVHKISTDQVWKTAPDGTSFRRLIQIFHTMCETMAFAHSLGVIHRDLKPQNVMIGDFGEVLIVDWGLAKILGQAWEDTQKVQTDRYKSGIQETQYGTVAGTPIYMSPEQARGEIRKLGPASDVYTLGAILYEILSGKAPYNGKTVIEVIKLVQSTKPPSLLSLFEDMSSNTSGRDDIEWENVGKIPIRLVQICEKAMAREIRERYSSAGELAREIHDWLEGAQKRDKALKEFESAQNMLQDATAKEAIYQQNWEKTNQLLQKDILENGMDWREWDEGLIALQEAKQLHQEYRRTLQGALVYDPELEEANEALAILLQKDILLSLAKGEQERLDIFERQFKNHVRYLPKRKQKKFLEEFEANKQDNIRLLRTKQGALVGRKKQKKAICERLSKQARFVSLIGTAGVGKTRLALEVLHDLQTPDTNVYFCDVTEATSELGIALAVAKAMNLKLRNIDPVGQLGEIFESQDTILLLDNLEQAIKAAGVVITSWLKQAPSLRIIATSRVKLRLTEENAFIIQPLSILEGIEVFTKKGQQVNKLFRLTKKTRTTVGKLVLQLDNLPLAIELAASRLSLFSVEEIAERLKERFSLLRSREKGTQALQGALDWSWDLLKPWEKSVFSQSSVFHGGFNLQAAEAILDCTEWSEAPPIFDILQDLCENSLLQQNKSSEGTIRYGMLESIRQYSKTKRQDISSQQTLEYRHAKYFSQFGKKKYLDELDNQIDQKKWDLFLEELDNFITGTKRNFKQFSSLCCMAAMKILGMKGPISLGVDLVEETLKNPYLSSRERKQLEILQTRFLRISGRMNEARQKQFLQKEQFSKSSTKTRDMLLLQAEELLEKGRIEATNSENEKARSHYQKAYRLYQRAKYDNGLIETLISQSSLSSILGNNTEALKDLEEALNIAEENNLQSSKATVYSHLGRLNREQSNYDDALEFFMKALEIYKQSQNILEQNKILTSVAETHRKMGNNQEALQYFQDSALLTEKSGDAATQATNYFNIAALHQHFGQYEKALEYYKKAIKLSKELGNRRLEANIFGGMGILYLHQGQNEKALFHLREEISINEELGYKQGVGILLGNLALVYQNLNLYEKAIGCYLRGLTIAREVGSKKSEGVHLGGLGLVYSALGQPNEAIIYYRQAVDIAREIGAKEDEGVALGNLGSALSDGRRWDEAREVFIRAIELCEERHKIAAGLFRGYLAWVYAQESKLDKAIELLEQGEPDVQKFPMVHGQFLCKKAKILHLASETQEAEQALEQAQKIAKDINTDKNSFFGKLLTSTAEFLSVEPSKEKSEHSDDLRIQADGLLEKGKFEEAEALYEESLIRYRKALEIYQSIKEKQGVIETFYLIAIVYRKLAKYDIALSYLEKALQQTKEYNGLAIRAKVYSSLGEVYQDLSNYPKALEFHLKALDISRSVNNRLEEGEILGRIGIAYQNLRKMKDSIAAYEQSILIAQEIGNKQNEGVQLGNIATVYSTLREYEKAIHYYQLSLKICQENQNKRSEGFVRGNLGSLYRNLGQYEKALEHINLSIEIVREIGNKRSEGTYLGNLGNIHSDLGQYNEAITAFKQAVQILREIGHKRVEGVHLGNLGNAYFGLGEYEQAMTYYQQAINLALEIKNKRSEGIHLGNLANTLLHLDRLNEAEENFRKAIQICDKHLPPAAGAFRGSFAWICAKQGKIQQAIEILKQGEDLVSVVPVEHGKFLCKKAQIYHLSSQAELANQALSQAEKIAINIKAKEDSELMKELENTRLFLGNHNKSNNK